MNERMNAHSVSKYSETLLRHEKERSLAYVTICIKSEDITCCEKKIVTGRQVLCETERDRKSNGGRQGPRRRTWGVRRYGDRV